MNFIKFVKSMALGLCLLGLIPAAAQPVVGAVYKESLSLGSGRRLALPEGAWKATRITSVVRKDFNWAIYIFTNQERDASIPFLVVRHTNQNAKWASTGCHTRYEQPFLVNDHGTKANDLLTKCSRFLAIADFRSWQQVENWKNESDKAWWADVVPGFFDPQRDWPRGMLFAELTVQKFNGLQWRVDAFVVPPKALTSVQISDHFKSGKPGPELEMLSNWADSMIMSMEAGFLRKEIKPVLALNYPIGIVESSPNAVAQQPKIDIEKTEKTNATPPASSPRLPTPDATRLAEEKRLVEEKRLAEEKRLSEARRVAEEIRLAKENRAAEEKRLKAEEDRLNLEKKAREQALENQRLLAEVARLQAEAEKNRAKPEPLAHRKALVIGNNKYKFVSPLANASEDAKTIAGNLELVGYKVTLKLDASEREMRAAIRSFASQVQGGDEVAFYFAGHGVQIGSANYLIPVDVNGESEAQIRDEAVALQRVLDDMTDRKAKFTLAVIDACRDNPFKLAGRNVGSGLRGLAPTNAATGQMVIFSAGAGQKALDSLGPNDKNKNGVFTRVFVQQMQKPAVPIDKILKDTRTEVVNLAQSIGHEQVPAIYDQVIGEFFFKR